MTEPTDADRDAAEVISAAWETSGQGYGYLDELIADALAEERAKARAETMDWVIDQIGQGATFGRFEVDRAAEDSHLLNAYLIGPGARPTEQDRARWRKATQDERFPRRAAKEEA